MKVALVYDRVNKWGGAERVLLALHKIFPSAPLYTSVYHHEKAKWAKVFNVKTSFLQYFPFARSYHQLYAPLMPFAFESFNFDKYDLVISVTSEAAKGIITKPETKHICYCLTPTRYLWSGYEDYFSNKLLKIVSWIFVYHLRAWDKMAARRVDKFIAISSEVQKRIKKYYDRESTIVYPPIGLSSTDYGLQQKRKAVVGSPSPESFFLIVSRLVPYKRIDLAVKVFNKLGLKLKIIGKGSQETRLKETANENIEFLGYLTDKELVKYYKGCLALIFPGREDFGLTILEAQSFGKPVIAYRGGGALETVIEGKTGIFFDSQKQKSLEEAIKKFMSKKFNPKDAINNSKNFGFDKFKKKFEENIELSTIRY